MRTHKSIADALTATRASTKTYFDANGVMQTAAINEFPVEYDPATLQPRGISVWPARTNNFFTTDVTDQANWTRAGGTAWATYSAIAGGAINGGDCIRIIPRPDAGEQQHYLYDAPSPITLGVDQCVSVYAKDQGWGQYHGGTEDNQGAFSFTALIEGTWRGFMWGLSTGRKLVAGSVPPAYIEQLDREDCGNGWYRYTLKFQENVSTTPQIRLATGKFVGGAPSFYSSGNNVAGFDLCLPQLEAGPFPSPFIPTSGAAATRAVDDIWIEPRKWASFSRGSVILDFENAHPGAGANTIFVPYPSSGYRSTKVIQIQYHRAYATSGIDMSIADASGDNWLTEAGRHVAGFSYDSDRLAWASMDGVTGKSGQSDQYWSMHDPFYPQDGGIAWSKFATGIPPSSMMSGWIRRIAWWPDFVPSAILNARTA